MRFVILVCLLGACSPMPPPVEPDVDAGPPASCAEACTNMRKVCGEANATAREGSPCEAVCDAVTSSPELAWDLDCLARAKSCEATDRCGKHSDLQQ